jgi:cobalt-zinc-cadmium efflux system protein
MKTDKNILIAFVLNLSFSLIEFIGGIFTGSVAIISDSVHDMGDALSIGIAYALEKKSKKQPDENYTYGYGRFSVLGGLITTVVLLIGSVAVIVNAVRRIINPTEINYDGMMIFAFVGIVVNFAAAYFTREGDSINQRAVNLHMLEDVLGWVVVLVGALVMRFTDLAIIDPIMSIGVAVYIFTNACKNLKEVLDIFLEKTPEGLSVGEIAEHLCELEGVAEVHHIHLRTIDGHSVYATMHIVAQGDAHEVKHKARDELSEFGIIHSTLEIESVGEHCDEKECRVSHCGHIGHHHHH